MDVPLTLDQLPPEILAYIAEQNIRTYSKFGRVNRTLYNASQVVSDKMKEQYHDQFYAIRYSIMINIFKYWNAAGDKQKIKSLDQLKIAAKNSNRLRHGDIVHELGTMIDFIYDAGRDQLFEFLSVNYPGDALPHQFKVTKDQFHPRYWNRVRDLSFFWIDKAAGLEAYETLEMNNEGIYEGTVILGYKKYKFIVEHVENYDDVVIKPSAAFLSSGHWTMDPGYIIEELANVLGEDGMFEDDNEADKVRKRYEGYLFFYFDPVYLTDQLLLDFETQIDDVREDRGNGMTAELATKKIKAVEFRPDAFEQLAYHGEIIALREVLEGAGSHNLSKAIQYARLGGHKATEAFLMNVK